MAFILATVGRLALAALFVLAGLSKIISVTDSIPYTIAASDVPGAFVLGVGIFEVVAGLLLAVGFASRLTSLVLIAYLVLATIVAHSQVTDPTQLALAMKNLAIVGGLAMMAAYAQLRSHVGVLEERHKRYDAEERAARAEGRAEARETVVEERRDTRVMRPGDV